MIGAVKMLVVVMQFPPRLFDSISVVVVPKYSSLFSRRLARRSKLGNALKVFSLQRVSSTQSLKSHAMDHR